jgi:hypothetical protein
MTMRRVLLTLGAALVLAVFVNPVDAQLKFGAHGAVITGLDEVLVGGTDINAISGTFGLGGRVMLDPPLFPVALVGSGTYYFTDDAVGSFKTLTVAAQLRIPLPIVKPYATGGWQIRSAEGADSESGPVIGAGVQLDLGLSLFLEGTFEMSDEIPTTVTGLTTAVDTNRIVIKGGLMFG